MTQHTATMRKTWTARHDDPRFLTSVARGFQVFDALSNGSGPMSLTELAAATGLSVPTVQRLTATLVCAGYLAKDSHSKRYRPTVKTVNLLYSYLSRNQFAKRAWPHLVKLREDVGLDVSLSVRVGDAMIYVHRLPGYAGNFENTLPGKKVPIHLSASGRSLLSLWETQKVQNYLSRLDLCAQTPWSLTDSNAIAAKIADCREKGFAFVKQEASPGLMTLACPVVCGTEAISGVSVHAPVASLSPEDFKNKVLPLVVSVSQALSTPASFRP